MTRVSVRTLGCKVNQVESEEMLSTLLGGAFEIVDESDAEIVVVNTCTVTGEADAKARKAIRHALRVRTRPLVVVTGCLAKVEGESVAALGDRVVVEPDYGRVPALLSGLAHAGAPVRDRPVARAGVAFHARGMVKVEDGCDAYCAYCIVPFARGAPSSVRLRDVLAECDSLVRAGIGEIVLTGINLGRWRDERLGLPDLIEAVASTGVRRLRISSVEPMDLTDDLLCRIEGIESFCRHLHVPLQSGQDAILREMGRNYSIEQYAERIEAARRMLPGVAITTDVLAGFPGECDNDAQATLEFCASQRFSRMHVFRYSPRRKTAAARRPDQVDAAAKSARAARLRALDAALRTEYAGQWLGRTGEVLVERIVRDGARGGRGAVYAEGTSREYLRVRVPVDRRADIRPGDVVDVEILGVGETPAAPLRGRLSETERVIESAGRRR